MYSNNEKNSNTQEVESKQERKRALGYMQRKDTRLPPSVSLSLEEKESLCEEREGGRGGKESRKIGEKKGRKGSREEAAGQLV